MGYGGPQAQGLRESLLPESPVVASHSVSRGSTAGDGGAVSSEARGATSGQHKWPRGSRRYGKRLPKPLR